MAWMNRFRAAGMASAGALMLLGVACSEDKPSNGGGDDESSNGDGEDEGLDQGQPGEETDEEPKDAGSRMDARVNMPDTGSDKPDAGDAGPAITIPDGAVPPVPKPDAAVISNALTPLPHDGDRGSICYSTMDCTGDGDDLSCFLPPGSAIPGYCVDDCNTDADCQALDGVKGVCDKPLLTEGTCFYPCGGPKNDGKGECPDKMLCENFSSTPLLPDWRCRYPAGGGKKTEEPFTKCDLTHGPGDCEGLASCVRPALNAVSAVITESFCSPLCTKDADCKTPEDGTTALARCEFGFCQFDCTNDGARCPTGMNCWDIDPSQLLFTMRCVYK